mmetsp:Transcript_20253/g.51375  ORF Transcript_20253/g.51375 Transcript_20253/m.51375 type:complete len:596 (+) Transcript_20253:287-2074(+)
MQRLNIPKGANIKGVTLIAKIILVVVALHLSTDQEVFLDHLEGGEEARISVLDEAELGQEQQHGVHLITAERRHETLPRLVPRLVQHVGVYLVGLGAPQLLQVGLLQVSSDLGQAVAGHPTADGRVRVHLCDGAQLPDAGVGLVGELVGTLAQRLETLEEVDVADGLEALVEEVLRTGHDNAAEHVVLALRVGAVAHAHRTHATVAGERGAHHLGEVGLQADAVAGLHECAVGRLGVVLRDQVGQVVQVALHGGGGAQTIEHLHHVVGVAQPAVAVVPVATAVGVLGDRGGERCHDGARVLQRAQLERDGGTDHLLLELGRDGQVARVVDPVGGGCAVETLVESTRMFTQTLVRSHHKVDRFVVQNERSLAQNVGHRRIGGDTKNVVIKNVANVVASVSAGRDVFTVLEGGPDQDANARSSVHQSDTTQHGERMKHTIVIAKARTEILDLERATALVEEHCLQDGRVAHVCLLAVRKVVHDHGPITPAGWRLLELRMRVHGHHLFGARLIEEGILVGLGRGVVSQQTTEDRVTVETRIATPHNRATTTDESRCGTVADDATLQRVCRTIGLQSRSGRWFGVSHCYRRKRLVDSSS